jgi:hypothetical protein
LKDLLGLPVESIYDNRLYRALDRLLPHKRAIECHLRGRLGELFALQLLGVNCFADGIDSRFLLLGAAWLPHLNCCPSSAQLSGSGRGDGEATKHGDTQRVEGGDWAALPSGWGWERRQILDEFTRVTGYHRKHALRVLHRPFVPQPP